MFASDVHEKKNQPLHFKVLIKFNPPPWLNKITPSLSVLTLPHSYRVCLYLFIITCKTILQGPAVYLLSYYF